MDPTLWIVTISVLGPVIGSTIGVMRMPSFGYICNMLCFAAGVMLAISFLELVPESLKLSSPAMAIAGVFIGSTVMYGLDRIIPHIHPKLCAQEQGCNLERTSVYLLLGMFLHNFPEGMAIAIGTVSGVNVSLAIALAIAIHNIPEGICTSAPYYHSTGKRLKSFLLSSSTALPVLAGYVTAKYLFQSISPQIVGLLSGATAGLMIYITADELIPNSCTGTNHQTIFSLILGIAFVMVLGML
ncbi:MAG: ZIP family metal transporter [Thermodesulfobacteriota bacterium]|nr:ZIP family metal transporter [Thermodesulfobacteriota bacterium]